MFEYSLTIRTMVAVACVCLSMCECVCLCMCVCMCVYLQDEVLLKVMNDFSNMETFGH